MENMKKEKKSVKTLKMFLNKEKDELVLNPELSDDRKNMGEAAVSHGVLVYARMNPPTTGHKALVKKMHDIAKQTNGSHVLVVSHSQDAKKNPLSSDDKLKHLKRFFPKTNIELASKEHPTFLQHAAKLHSQGVEHLHMVAGSDRVEEFKDRLNKYNGTGEGKLFNFKHISVHSAGERDPDSDDVQGMSASKMREHAKNNDLESFKKGIPSHISDNHAKELFHDTRKGMNIKESVDEAVLDISARRKRAINLKKRHSRLERQKQLALKRFASDLKLRRRARNVARALVRTRVAGKRGANYTNLSVNDKIAVDKMIQGKEKLVKAIAGKLYQRIRKREAERVSRVRGGLTAKRQSKILNAEFDYETFSSMYDSLVENRFVIPQKELVALKIKSTNSNIPLEKLEEVYRQAASEYTDSNLTLQQYCFNKVNSFISNNVSEDAAQSHERAATVAQQNGKPLRANLHRKIAQALKRGDNTTARGFREQLRNLKESSISQLEESYNVGIGTFYTAQDLGMKTKGGFAYHPSVLEELIASGKLDEKELEMAIEELKNCNYNLKKVRRPNE